MLFDNNIVTDGEPKPSSFSGGLGWEERIERFFLHLRRNTDAIVPHRYLDTIAQIPGRGSKSWLVIAAITIGSAFGRCVKPVRDKVQQSPCNVLWEDVDFTS